MLYKHQQGLANANNGVQACVQKDPNAEAFRIDEMFTGIPNLRDNTRASRKVQRFQPGGAIKE